MKRIRDLRRELGPLSQDEMLITIILATSLLLWITESFHGLNSGLLSLALTLILFIPRIGFIKIGSFTKEVPWGSITLFAASMFLAKAVSCWSALDPVAQSIFNNLNLSSLPLPLFISLIIFVAMFLHVIFTSTTVYATVIIPLVISIAQLRGFQSQIIAIPVAFLTPSGVDSSHKYNPERRLLLLRILQTETDDRLWHHNKSHISSPHPSDRDTLLETSGPDPFLNIIFTILNLFQISVKRTFLH